MKQASIYVAFTLFLTLFLINFFSPLYTRTQKIKTAQKPFSEINLNAVNAVSASMEKISKTEKENELTVQELTQRTNKLPLLMSLFPNAHALYTNKCLSCHGPLGEGGKALYSFDTRLNHRNSSYGVSPLKKSQAWNSDIYTFFVAASKQNKLHLPQNLQTLETDDITQLKQYLSQLTE